MTFCDMTTVIGNSKVWQTNKQTEDRQTVLKVEVVGYLHRTRIASTGGTHSDITLNVLVSTLKHILQLCLAKFSAWVTFLGKMVKDVRGRNISTDIEDFSWKISFLMRFLKTSWQVLKVLPHLRFLSHIYHIEDLSNEVLWPHTSRGIKNTANQS